MITINAPVRMILTLSIYIHHSHLFYSSKCYVKSEVHGENDRAGNIHNGLHQCLHARSHIKSLIDSLSVPLTEELISSRHTLYSQGRMWNVELLRY